MITLVIDRPFITLQQALKMSGLIPSGGAAKIVLGRRAAVVNGEPENRRGRKLYPGDTVEIFETIICISQS
ncbi:MAG: RNA-binding S4 domain-containing protein [Acidimicrobiales bacterium]